MHGVTVSSSASPVPPPPSSLPHATQTAAAPLVQPPERLEVGAAHDEDLIVAALEDLASRREALEWLLEAGLLQACLV